MAIDARWEADNHAVSWRKFFVGSCVLASNGKDLRIFCGANLKPMEAGHKACAEQVALKNAFEQGYTDIYAIVVAGQPQVDEATGKQGQNLPPCGGCRTIMKRPYNLSPNTLVYLVTREGEGPCELYTLQEIWNNFSN